jgi:iron complex outermembrane receptor protein
VSLAIFLIDYTDLQVATGIRPGVIDIANAAEATIRGIELEGRARIGGIAAVGGHAVWLDARYDRYLATGVGGLTRNVAGHRLNNAPEWSARLWVDGTRRIGSRTSLSVRVDANWQSTVYFSAFNEAIERHRPYGLLNVTAELTPLNRRWSVGAYARNLTNEDYITGSFGTPAPAIGGRPGQPRQVGVQFAAMR